MDCADPLNVLGARPEWGAAVEQPRSLVSRHGEEASRRLEAYARFYAGRRGSMVLDVVLSGQRRYQDRVMPLADRWEADSKARSFRWLAAYGPDQKRYGLRAGESATTLAVASNLATLADGLGLGEDERCLRSAQGVTRLEHAPELDPVVGSVSGIGLALFAYLVV